MLYKSIFDKSVQKKNSVILIGFFDAMHLGHQAIIKQLVHIAQLQNLNSVVLTYENLAIKQHSAQKILKTEEKLAKIGDFGVNDVILADFDEIRNIDADKFIDILKNNFNVTDFLVGYEFKFGRECLGTPQTLVNAGIRVHQATVITDSKNNKISTSDIKDFLLNGDIQSANKLLGRYFSIGGTVKQGKQLGRTLGFPTMNINTETIRPQSGAYISQTHVDGMVLPSMTFVSDEIIETHVLGYKKFAYNYQILVDFFKKIRDNKIFKNLEELKQQLTIDLQIIRDFFNENKIL